MSRGHAAGKWQMWRLQRPQLYTQSCSNPCPMGCSAGTVGQCVLSPGLCHGWLHRSLCQAFSRGYWKTNICAWSLIRKIFLFKKKSKLYHFNVDTWRCTLLNVNCGGYWGSWWGRNRTMIAKEQRGLFFTFTLGIGFFSEVRFKNNIRTALLFVV